MSGRCEFRARGLETEGENDVNGQITRDTSMAPNFGSLGSGVRQECFGDVGGRHGKVQESTASTICERGLLQGRLDRHETYILCSSPLR